MLLPLIAVFKVDNCYFIAVRHCGSLVSKDCTGSSFNQNQNNFRLMPDSRQRDYFRHQQMEDFHIEPIIAHMLEVPIPARGLALSQEHLILLCTMARQICLSQPRKVRVEKHHKFLVTLSEGLDLLLKFLRPDSPPPVTAYIFLGDHVDWYSPTLDEFCVFLACKIKFPRAFFMLSAEIMHGAIGEHYRIYDDCKRRYSTKLYKTICDCLRSFPGFVDREATPPRNKRARRQIQ